MGRDGRFPQGIQEVLNFELDSNLCSVDTQRLVLVADHLPRPKEILISVRLGDVLARLQILLDEIESSLISAIQNAPLPRPSNSLSFILFILK